MATEEGDDNTEVKEDDDVETDVVEGADSPLVDEVGPCGSNEAEMLLSVVWRQIFEETDTKTSKKEKNRSQRRKTKKMAERNQHEGKLNAPMSHLIAVASYWTFTCQDCWPQALKVLLVVNSFKLHLNALKYAQ